MTVKEFFQKKLYIPYFFVGLIVAAVLIAAHYVYLFFGHIYRYDFCSIHEYKSSCEEHWQCQWELPHTNESLVDFGLCTVREDITIQTYIDQIKK